MSIKVQLCYINGETKDMEIMPSELVGDKKKSEHQEMATWKCSGKVLKNDKTFDFYDIEPKDIIYSSHKHHGGKNFK